MYYENRTAFCIPQNIFLNFVEPLRVCVTSREPALRTNFVSKPAIGSDEGCVVPVLVPELEAVEAVPGIVGGHESTMRDGESLL